MISIYEAVVPAVQQQANQAPGAVVPQQATQLQQTQPVQASVQQPQVPVQQPAAAQQQPAAAPAQVQPAQTSQFEPPAQPEDKWKKYLKYSAIGAGGVGLGALAYLAGQHIGDMIPSASVPFFGDKTETDSSGGAVEDLGQKTKDVVHGTSSRPQRIAAEPAPMVGPPSPHYERPQEQIFGVHRPANQPQPGGASYSKIIDPLTGRQTYAGNGGWGQWASNTGSTASPRNFFSGSNRPAQPITDYDLGRRSGDMNGG